MTNIRNSMKISNIMTETWFSLVNVNVIFNIIFDCVKEWSCLCDIFFRYSGGRRGRFFKALRYCAIGDLILLVIKLQGYDKWVWTHCKYLFGHYMICYRLIVPWDLAGRVHPVVSYLCQIWPVDSVEIL